MAAKKTSSVKSTLERIKNATCWIEEAFGRMIFHFAFIQNAQVEKAEYAVNKIEDLDLEALTERGNDLKNELARKKVIIESTVLALDLSLVMHEVFDFPKLARKEINRTREMQLENLYTKYPAEFTTVLTERQEKKGIYQDIYLVRKIMLTKTLYLLRRAGIKVTSIIRLIEALADKTFADRSLVIALQLKRTLVIAKDHGEALACLPLSRGYSVFREKSDDIKALFSEINFAYDRMANLLPQVSKVYLFFDKTMNVLEKASFSQGELSEITTPIETNFHQLILSCTHPKVSFSTDIE